MDPTEELKRWIGPGEGKTERTNWKWPRKIFSDGSKLFRINGLLLNCNMSDHRIMNTFFVHTDRKTRVSNEYT